MSTKVVGKLDGWDQGDVGTQTSFIRLEEGSNQMRVVSSPYQFYAHWTKDEANQTRKVHCALKDCPLCARGEEAKPSWYIAVLSRKTNTVGIVEIGSQIFKQIKDLSKKPKWGDPRSYDLDITRQPKGSQPLYVVAPEPKEPLTEEEKTMIRSAMEKIDLQKLVEAPTPAELREKLGMDAKSNPAVEAEIVADESDLDDFNFDSK